MNVAGASHPESIKAVPVRHSWRWVAAAVIALLFGSVAYTVATAPRLQWDQVWYWLFHHSILEGLVGTLELTVLAMVIGVGLGAVLAVMRLTSNPVMGIVSWCYIWFFRGTPVLVQLFFWWNLPLILPDLGISIPFTSIGWHESTVKVITPFLASMLGLGLNEGAYMAEIVRAGIISVEFGQTEAAQALGMSRIQVLRRVVLPQAMRVIIPPTGNETISMLKTSSLASITTFGELFRVTTLIYSYNYRVLELLIVASIWYLFMTSILTVGQYYIERYFARGSVRQLPPTPLQRLRRVLFTLHAPSPGQSS
jgi:polar amino acid transport system permease protein